MPRINRIRIINFSYNNDNRHILDQTFNFYRGENALLSLKNGGGKSVLVQLLMQPVIPMVSIQRRGIRDFFKKKRTPTYVLIEWSLDDKGGYLLTGIGMAAREVQVKENQDTDFNMRYFTFTHQYRQANPFDIAHIPLCSRDGNQLTFLPIKEASQLLQEKSRDSKLQLTYFSQDDGEAYRNHLVSFNISQDEWRNIITRINNDEGGVIEIFEKCKTSQQLMNEWVIKTVEKVIYKDREDHRKLEQMLENLVDEMIQNEQFIHEKTLLEGFLNELGTFAGDLENLVKGFDEQKKLEGQSAALYDYVDAAIERNNEKIENNSKVIEEGITALKGIQLEERSLEYYRWKEKLDKRTELWVDLCKQLAELEKNLKSSIRNRDIQKAAELLAEIGELSVDLAGLEEEIARSKGESVNKEKISSLEYSLKFGYEKRLQKIEEDADKLNLNLKNLKQANTDNKEKENNLDLKLRELNRQKGVLDKGMDDFKKFEERTKLDIGFTMNRNLFGEADAVEVQKISNGLKSKHQTLINEKQELGNRLVNYKARLGEIKLEKIEIQKDKDLKQKEIEEFEREIKAYTETEENLKRVFIRQGLDFERRFFQSECKRELEIKVNNLQENQFYFKREYQNITKTLESLSRGTLHVPDDFSSYLENHDFNFETGESYLLKQSPDIRERLLSSIPLLPYAFIMTQEEIDRLKGFCPDHPIYQLIPLISYSALKESFASDGRLVKAEKGLSLLCLYNQKMLATEDMVGYLRELERERDETQEKVTHYTDSLKIANRDLETVIAFQFDKGYLHRITLQQKSVINKRDELNTIFNQLDQEENSLQESTEKAYMALIQRDSDIGTALMSIQKYDEYILANEAYEGYVKEASQWRSTFDRSSDELKEVKKEINRLNEKINVYESEQKQHKENQRLCLNNLEKYKSSKETMLIDEDIESLERRLNALRGEISANLERLNQYILQKNKDKKRKEQEIVKLNLILEDYDQVAFDRAQLEKYEIETQGLVKDKDNIVIKVNQSDKTCVDANARMSTALTEVKKLSDEPTPKQEIRMDFEGRRKGVKRTLTEKERENDDIKAECKAYSKIINEIESLIDIRKYARMQVYLIKKSISEDHIALIKDIKAARIHNTSQERGVNGLYTRMVMEFRDKNEHIANIFKGLGPVKQQAEEDTEKYYYLYERAVGQKDVLGDLIRIYANQLANLERNKLDMVTQSGLHAVRIYEEVEKITQDSAIRIEGRTRAIPMLQIIMEKPEIEARNNEKMRSYIESCIAIVQEDMKKEKKKEDIRKGINKCMSSRELLNVISDLSKLVIKAYKVDVNASNSEHKTWEQVMKENSGGERFVSFFAVLAALMSYTRSSSRVEDDFVRNKDTKVLIMDNPFGPISSEHLLKPLFEIAKKYNTQLICLTDLKQNSILNCFNLIYMLKIRASTLGTNEYLEAQAQIREDAEFEYDENLDKAIFRAGDFEQMRLM